MPNPEVYIVSAVRTAIGSFGGTLKDTPPCELATTAVSAALQRSGCVAERVGHVEVAPGDKNRKANGPGPYTSRTATSHAQPNGDGKCDER